MRTQEKEANDLIHSRWFWAIIGFLILLIPFILLWSYIN